MSDPQPRTERPYQVDDAWSRAVFARRTGAGAAAFLLPHLRPGMRLIDCGCGPGSITIDLAQAVAPGDAIDIVDGSAPFTFGTRRTQSWRRGIGSECLSASTTRAVHHLRSSYELSVDRRASHEPKPRVAWPRRLDRLPVRLRRHAESLSTT
jgi:hypothetical protein